MYPAYQIPLSEKELAQLGRLTVILGQVDDEMVKTIGTHLRLNRAAANIVLGSSAIRVNSAIWAAVIQNRTKDEETLWLVKHAQDEMKAISEARNDFIHAVFSHPIQMVGGVMVQGGPPEGSVAMISTPTGPMAVSRRPPLARRVRNSAMRSVDELPGIIDRAGRLSCLVAHIYHLTVYGDAPSPWLGRLGPTLPPRPPIPTPRRQGKGRKRQRGSSRA